MVNFRDSYFQVDWDLSHKRLKGTFWGKQYDTGRGFAVTVINGGQVVTPTNEVLRLKWEKPDNTTGYVNATIVNGKFIVENIDQMFTVHGSVRADFELSVAGKFVASITFYVNVEKAVAVDAIESSSDFSAFQQSVADFSTAVAGVTSDTEVILARGTEATLGARLDASDAQLNDTDQRIDLLVTTPVPVGEIVAQEIIDARDGEPSVGAKVRKIDGQVSKIKETAENSLKVSGIANEKTFLVKSDIKTKKAYMTIVDDDARKEVWTYLKPLAEELGIPITIASNVVNYLPPEEHLTVDQMLYLQDNLGWEIASHSHNHDNIRILSEEEIDYQLRESNRVLTSWGLKIKNFVAPFGTNDSAVVRKVAARYYNTSTSVSVGINTRPVKNHYLKRIPLGTMGDSANLNFTYYKAQLDNAIAAGGWVIYMTHIWDRAVHDATQDQYLRDLIVYAQSQGVEIVNLQKGFEEFGNFYEVEGVVSIAHNGSFKGLEGIDLLSKYDNNQNSASPITEYQYNTININDITSVKKGTYPDMGMLYTYRPLLNDGANDYWGYQLLFGVTRGIHYRRSISPTEWGEWSNFLPRRVSASVAVPAIPSKGFQIITLTVPSTFAPSTAITAFPSDAYEELFFCVIGRTSTTVKISLMNTATYQLPAKTMTWALTTY